MPPDYIHGPWTCDGGTIRDAEGEVIAHMERSTEEQEWLISQAPVMLEMLRRLSEWRPHGLFGQIEDEVAGWRQEALAMVKRLEAD
jgi:hypothetical protein